MRAASTEHLSIFAMRFDVRKGIDRMAITLELTPEQEEKLRDAALARGLSVEGYLLTLIDAIVLQKATLQPRKPLHHRALDLLFGKSVEAQAEEDANPDKAVRETIRRMRESVLQYKEQAVDAVTTMNMLRKAVDLQERQAAEKELQAVRALAEQKPDQAKRRWQEKTVLEKHLEAVKEELAAATLVAATRTRAFRKEEERVQERATKAQADALKAYQSVMLPADRIDLLIVASRTAEEWDQAFEEWVLLTVQGPPDAMSADDLPKPIPVDDAAGFTQQALAWAKAAKNKPSATDTPQAEGNVD
jgi:hypothetical protein